MKTAHQGRIEDTTLAIICVCMYSKYMNARGEILVWHMSFNWNQCGLTDLFPKNHLHKNILLLPFSATWCILHIGTETNALYTSQVVIEGKIECPCGDAPLEHCSEFQVLYSSAAVLLPWPSSVCGASSGVSPWETFKECLACNRVPMWRWTRAPQIRESFSSNLRFLSRLMSGCYLLSSSHSREKHRISWSSCQISDGYLGCTACVVRDFVVWEAGIVAIDSQPHLDDGGSNGGVGSSCDHRVGDGCKLRDAIRARHGGAGVHHFLRHTGHSR